MNQQVTYLNPFHDIKIVGSSQHIKTDVRPTEYKGYKIFHRGAGVFDIVKNNICFGMNAGLNGAKKRIDNNDFSFAKFLLKNQNPH